MKFVATIVADMAELSFLLTYLHTGSICVEVLPITNDSSGYLVLSCPSEEITQVGDGERTELSCQGHIALG